MGFYDGLGVPDMQSKNPGTDLGGGKAQSGFGTRMYMGEQDDYNEYIDDLHDFYQQTWEGVNFGVIQNANPIVPTRIRADRSPIPNERGRVDVSGGISLQGNVLSLLPFWKLVTMTPGKGKTTFAAPTGAAADTPPANAGSGNIAVGSLGDPAGGLGKLNVCNQHQYDYSDKPNAAASITGVTDLASLTATTGLTVPDAAQPGVTTGGLKNIAPAQLEFTIAGTGFTQAIANTGKATIVGKDQNGIPLTDTVDVTYSNATTMKFKTDYYFETIDANGVHVTGLAGATVTGLRVQALNAKFVHRYTIQDSILDGTTLYIVKGGNKDQDADAIGGIPNVYVGCIPNNCTWGFGETVTLDIDWIGRNGYARVTPATIAQYGQNWGKNHIVPDLPKGGSGNTAWDFAGAADETYLGWEGGIQIRQPGDLIWTTIPCSDMSVTLNHNLTHPERYWFRRWHVAPIPSDQMEIMVDATVDYKTRQGLDFLQLQNIDLEARLIAFYRPVGGQESFVRMDLKRCQLNAPMDPAVSGSDIITQSFALKASTKDTSSADVYESNAVVIDVQSEQQFGDLVA